jgi:DNA-binding NarL/FixJ family response regulator
LSANGKATGPILVVDDDRAFRELVRVLMDEAGFRTVEAGAGREAVALGREHGVPLAVVDVVLPDISGYEVCRALRHALGERLPVVFVSGVKTDPHDRVAGLLLGADDYLVKPFLPDELVARVRRLLAQRCSREDSGFDRGELTSREHEVLELLTEGLSPAEIAARLVISAKTVGTHLEHIFRKLDVHSRAEAVAVALGAGRRSAA